MSKCVICGSNPQVRYRFVNDTSYWLWYRCTCGHQTHASLFDVIYIHDPDDARHNAIIQRELDLHKKPVPVIDQQLRDLRRRLGITHAELAHAIKMSRTTIWRLEHGGFKRNPKSRRRIMDYLNQQLQKGKVNESLS